MLSLEYFDFISCGGNDMKNTVLSATLVLLIPVVCLAIQDQPQIKAEKIADDILVISGYYYDDHMVAVSTGIGLVVIDTLESPEATRKGLGLIREFSKEPVVYLINTHFHGDHIWGNQVFEDIAIVGHARSQAYFELEHESAAAQHAGMAQYADSLKEALATAEPDSSFARDLRDQITSLEAASGGFDDFELTTPTLLVCSETTIRLGDKTINIKPLEKCHTDTDMLVYIKEDGVLIIGDLLLPGMIPFIDTTRGGSLTGLISGLEMIKEDYDSAQIVVPGHFAPTAMHAVDDPITYLKTVLERVKELKDQGKTLEEVKSELELKDYDSFFMYRQLHPANVEIAWNELK
jgi:glyoxylase-like metal-dependent hydrolase (beta-lactamase superfamily II)